MLLYLANRNRKFILWSAYWAKYYLQVLRLNFDIQTVFAKIEKLQLACNLQKLAACKAVTEKHTVNCITFIDLWLTIILIFVVKWVIPLAFDYD